MRLFMKFPISDFPIGGDEGELWMRHSSEHVMGSFSVRSFFDVLLGAYVHSFLPRTPLYTPLHGRFHFLY